MNAPTKNLPPNYIYSGSVSLKRSTDLTAMLIWSLMLFFLPIPLIYLALRGHGTSGISFAIRTPLDFFSLLAGILIVTVVMLILHEGLHGLVFWLTTRDRPKFAFKWYYASACAEGWYLPRVPYLTATLLPLIAITSVGCILLPYLSSTLRYLMVLLILFNSSGCAGDVVVAIRLLRLPKEALSLDKGDEVLFFNPSA